MKEKDRKYCSTCNQFMMPNDLKDHSQHTKITPVSDEMLKYPIKNILQPVELNSANAVKYSILKNL